jgi:hypothetical protein
VCAPRRLSFSSGYHVKNLALFMQHANYFNLATRRTTRNKLAKRTTFLPTSPAFAQATPAFAKLCNWLSSDVRDTQHCIIVKCCFHDDHVAAADNEANLGLMDAELIWNTAHRISDSQCYSNVFLSNSFTSDMS